MANLIKHINPGFDGGSPDIPLGTGDRHYLQDYLRDFLYLKGTAGSLMDKIASDIPILISGGVVTQGGGTNLDITPCVGYHKRAVDVGEDFGVSLPPAVVSRDIIDKVESTQQTNLAIASAVADGATTNYVKLKFTNSDLHDRVRVKKSGSYYYEVEDSFEIVVDDVANTDYEILLNTFTLTAGGVFAFLGAKSNESLNLRNVNGLRIVNTQSEFNTLWERTAANAYKIKDEITSLLVMPLAGGYDCYSSSSFLSGGDAYGVFSTNNCLDMNFKTGAYLYVEDTISYINVSKSKSRSFGLDLRGLGTTEASITNSILFPSGVDNCLMVKASVSKRKQDVPHNVVRSITKTNKLINCKISEIGGSVVAVNTLNGFYGCYNSVGCIVDDIYSGSTAVAFYDCDFMENGIADNIEAYSDAWGFYLCDYMKSGFADNILSTLATHHAYGISTCNNMVSGTVGDCTSAGTSYGFFNCDDMGFTSSVIGTCDTDFYNCGAEPFKGDSDTATPYGYTEVRSGYGMTDGETDTYTPVKDCILFGFIDTDGTDGYMNIRNGAVAKTVDEKSYTTAALPATPFSIPVKGGVTVYFECINADLQFTLRYMPFGTTT